MLRSRTELRSYSRILRRGIVTGRTVYDVDLSLSIARAIEDSLKHANAFTESDRPRHALLLISRSFFPSSLSRDLARTVDSLVRQSIPNVPELDVLGAVVDRVGLRQGRGVSLLLVSESEAAEIGLLEDKVDREIRVGRAWKQQGADPEEKENTWTPTFARGEDYSGWKEIMGRGSLCTNSSRIEPKPSVTTAVLVSSDGFERVDWPSQMFPGSQKLGLVASQTPFLTGSPSTMIYNGRLVTAGGLGLGLTKAMTMPVMHHSSLKRLSEPLVITKAQGNILITLDGQPATYALLERIRAKSTSGLVLSKETRLFGQIDHESQSEASIDENKPMIRIIAGDPGKGSMALSGGYRVREGDRMQMYYQDTYVAANVAEGTPLIHFEGLAAEERHSDQIKEAGEGEESSSECWFGGASEGGLVTGGKGRGSWVCEASGSVTWIRIPSEGNGH